MSLTESMVPQSRDAALEGFLLRQGSGGPLGEGCLVPTTLTPAFSQREKEEDAEGMLLESLRGTTQQVSAVQIPFTRSRESAEEADWSSGGHTVPLSPRLRVNPSQPCVLDVGPGRSPFGPLGRSAKLGMAGGFADHDLEEHPVFRGFRITSAYGKAHATGHHRFPAVIAAPEDTAWRRILATVQDSETRLKGAS